MVKRIIGHWKLDEESGSIAFDSTSNGNNGEVFGTSIEDGLFGNARVFGFENADRIEVVESSLFNFQEKPFTLSFWTKLSSSSGVQGVVSKWDARVGVDERSWISTIDYGTGHIRFQASDNGSTGSLLVESSTNIADSQWHLTTITRNGPTYRLYVDGALEDENTSGIGNLFSTSTPLILGNFIDNAVATSPPIPDRSLDGYLDNVRIYNFELSSEEVYAQFYNGDFDVNPPIFEPVSPTDGETDIPLDADVIFDFKDDTGVNLDNLFVTFNENPVISAGLVEDGYFVDFSLTGDGYSDGYDGYRVTITNLVDWPELFTVEVEADGTDAYGTFAFETWSFTTLSTFDPPPTFDNLNPLPSSISHNPNTVLFFQFNDGYSSGQNAVSGVDTSTLNVIINGQNAVTSGVIQSGFTGSITTNAFDGVDISLLPDNGWQLGKTVNVSASGLDLNGTPAEPFSYSFAVGGGPVIDNISPGDGYTEVSRNTDVTFSVFDASFGIDIADIDVIINGELSSNLNTIENQDGYDVTISNPTFDEFSDIEVEILVLNRVGDAANEVVTFRTADETSPEIFPSIPSAGSQRVDPSTDISFDLVDGYSGIDTSTIEVSLDDTSVVTNGIGVNGYSITLFDIGDGYEVLLEGPGLSESNIVDVVITVSDLENNINFIEYNFSTDDLTPPVITNNDPTINGGAFVNTDISFDIHDTSGSGIDLDTLDVSIDGSPAISSGIEQAGFNVTITPDIIDTHDGYNITIDPDLDFAIGQTIPVSITLEDAYGNDTSLNYQFTIEDVNPPLILNELPTGINVSRLAPISFDIHDNNESGVDSNNIQVFLNGEQIITDSVPSADFDIDIAPKVINGFDGYSVVISPQAPYPLGSFNFVDIDGYDLQGNINQLSFFFEVTAAGDGVDFISLDPEPGETNVARDSTISFTAFDPDGFVDLNRLKVIIDDVIAVDNGKEASGYNLTVTDGYSDGYNISLTPPDLLPEFREVFVEIDGYDNSGNLSQTIYFFRTADETSPIINPILPVSGETNVQPNTDVIIDFEDGYSGIDLSSISITLNDTQIVTNGLVNDGYDVLFIETLDGYTAEISNITVNELQTSNVFVDVSDKEGNQATLNYNFSTGDFTGPDIGNISPPPFSIDVDRRVDIVFDITDPSGVDLSQLKVSAGDYILIDNGVAQPGYSIVTTPISQGFTISVGELVFVENQTLPVVIDGYDSLGNATRVEYELTGSFERPQFVPIFPLADQAGIPENSDITFEVTDAYGININTLNVSIYGGEAVKDGQPQDGYTVEYNTIADGYSVTIEVLDNLPEFVTVPIYANVEDNNNIFGEVEYEFITQSNLEPVYTSFSPPVSSTNQSAEQNISFNIVDPAGNGILLDSIEIFVNFTQVLSNSEVTDGYQVELNDFGDGYGVIIEHVPFQSNSRVFVSVSATNIDNNSSYFEYFYDTGEVDGPIIINQDPPIGSVDIPRNTDICFDVVDESGVDLSSVEVTIDGKLAFKDSSFVPPFDDVGSFVEEINDLALFRFPGVGPIQIPFFFSGDGYFDSDNDGYIDGYDDGYDGYIDGYDDGYDGYIPVKNVGYAFCFDNRVDFDFGQLVNVTVHSADRIQNESTRSYSFTVIDEFGPPIFDNIVPGPGDIDYPLSDPLTFSFIDTGSGADLNTLDVTIAGKPVIVNGVFQDGYSGSTIFKGDGYDVEIFPVGGFINFAEIPVTLFGEDFSGNSALVQYSFFTADEFAPVFLDVFPQPGSVDVQTDTPISFTFVDSTGIGADLNTLSVRVLGSLVVFEGQAQDGYEITSVLGPDGYEIEVFLNEPLPEFTEIDVILSGSDFKGNIGVFDFTFKTFDATGPVFDNLNPSIDSDLKVATDGPIFLDVLDPNGSGVNLNTFGINIGGVSIVDSGIIQPTGYTVEFLPIEDGYRFYTQSIGPERSLVEPDTVALYRLDGSTSVVVNDQGNSSLDGTALGPASGTGIFDKAREFSGGSDRVVISAEPELELQSFTIEGWVKPNVLSSNHVIYTFAPRQTTTQSRGVVFRLDSTGRLAVDLGDGTSSFFTIITTDTIPIGVFTHVAVVVDSSYVALYINGQEKARENKPISTIQYGDGLTGFPASATVLLGNRVNPFTGSFTNQLIGSLDDIRITSKSKSKSEIANNYNRSQNVRFDQFDTIDVFAFAQDNAGNDGYINYSFLTLDETPPVFVNINPTVNAQRADINADISFDFLDALSGPDIDTLNVTVNGDVVVENGIGFNSFVTFTEITDGYSDGYNVLIDLDTSLPEFKNIVITLDGYDLDLNQTIFTYQFSTDDITAPILTNEIPEDNSIDVTPFTDIAFDIHDFNGSGLNLDTLFVAVDDISAVIDGQPLPGWDFVVTPTYVDGYDGYNFFLEFDERFSLNSNIRVLVEGQDAYGNFLSQDYAFTTFNDQEPPQLQKFNPAPFDEEVSLNSDISFEIVDGYDVDLSRLDVTVDNAPAILDGLFQPGFNGPSSGIEQINDGYFINIDPQTNFVYNQQVTVTIDGYDFSNNQISFVYFFNTIADVNGPEIINRSPGDGYVDVPNNSDVSFEIIDDVSGVDLSLLSVNVGDSPAIINGVFQFGHDGPSSGIEPTEDGYRIVIDLVDGYEFHFNQINEVEITAFDFAGNFTQDIYTFFTVVDIDPPVISNLNPQPNQDEVPVATDISFDIKDDISGLDMTRLNVFVNSVPAILDGSFRFPFNDTNSSFASIADGYTVTIDLFVDFGFNELQNVVIDGYDLANNQVQFEYSFLTKVDVNGPTITPVFPKDSVGDILRDTDITIDFVDLETGVDSTTLDITINNTLALQDGVFVPGSGFDGPLSQIIQLNDSDGYRVFFDHTESFPAGFTVRVVTDGYDFANNQTHFEYIFTTIDDEGPEVFDFTPPPLSVDAQGDPVNIEFGIRDVGNGEVDLGKLTIEVSENVDEPFTTVFEPIEEFQNGWTGSITNAISTDGYVVRLEKDEQGESFALFTVRITAFDDDSNKSVTVIGKDGGLIDSGTGTVTGFNTLEVGEFFLNSNQVESGDIVLIDGVGSHVVDGYTTTEITLDRQIAAGGSVDFRLYRGSFILERRIFQPVEAEATSTKTIEVVFSDPPENGALNATNYSISPGDYPVNVQSVSQISENTFELTTDVPMQALIGYLLTVNTSNILNEFGFSIDDGYEIVPFTGFPDVEKPFVLSATNEPFNINVTVIFNEAMTQDSNLTNPNNYTLNNGAFVTSVEADPTELDRVVLTVERLFGRLDFEVFVNSALITDVFGNPLDLQNNNAKVNLEGTAAALSGLSGRLKTRNAINRLFEDEINWYLATSGGIDVVNKLDLQNQGFVLDGYGFNAITADDRAIYFGSNDGYEEDAYGVHRLLFEDLRENSTEKQSNYLNIFSSPAILSNNVTDLHTATNASVRLLGVATPEGATIVRDNEIAINYSSGNLISSIYFDPGGDTVYLGNNTLGRVEVYYGVSSDNADRTVPDAIYSVVTSPELPGNIINQIKVTKGTSIVDSNSNTIFVATNNGLAKIESDESNPGLSETNGITFTYGVLGSGADFELLGGEVQNVVSVDINLEQKQLFVATNDPSRNGGLTTINIPSNTRFSFNSNRGSLVSNDIRDIVFRNL